MDVKKAVLLVGALIIAVSAALMARSMFSSGNSAPQATASAVPEQEMGKSVLVATKALPVGTIIDAESFRFQPWPKELVETAYFIEGESDPQKLQGSVVRNAITAGQPVTKGALIQPGERGFLAAALGPGMRAVTVPVELQTSVAGFIFPGDRVDLLMTQNINGDEGTTALKVAETVVRNLRVLATDQRTNVMDENGQPVVRGYSNVTLEVTPRIAEKIAVAQNIGKLSLCVRLRTTALTWTPLSPAPPPSCPMAKTRMRKTIFSHGSPPRQKMAAAASRRVRTCRASNAAQCRRASPMYRKRYLVRPSRSRAALPWPK